jgi:hypothetical protein
MNANATALLTNPHPCAHIVYPYTDGALVGQAVCLFASAGLRNGEGVILILSAENHDAYMLRLITEGHDLESLKKSGRLVCLIAEDLLAACSGAGILAVEEFEAAVDEIIRTCKLASGRGIVRGFGELVGLVWNVDLGTTVSLEQMWNRVIDRHSVSLMCTYELKGRRDIPESARGQRTHSMTAARLTAAG